MRKSFHTVKQTFFVVMGIYVFSMMTVLMAAEFQNAETEILMPMVQFEKDGDIVNYSNVLAKIAIKTSQRPANLDHEDNRNENEDNRDENEVRKRNRREFSLRFEPGLKEGHDQEKLEKTVNQALRNLFGDFSPTKVVVQTSKGYSAKKNGTSISGALAVAMGASLKGKEMLLGLTVAFDCQVLSSSSRSCRGVTETGGQTCSLAHSLVTNGDREYSPGMRIAIPWG
jgi:hypothetical protein